MNGFRERNSSQVMGGAEAGLIPSSESAEGRGRKRGFRARPHLPSQAQAQAGAASRGRPRLPGPGCALFAGRALSFCIWRVPFLGLSSGGIFWERLLCYSKDSMVGGERHLGELGSREEPRLHWPNAPPADPALCAPPSHRTPFFHQYSLRPCESCYRPPGAEVHFLKAFLSLRNYKHLKGRDGDPTIC